MVSGASCCGSRLLFLDLFELLVICLHPKPNRGMRLSCFAHGEIILFFGLSIKALYIFTHQVPISIPWSPPIILAVMMESRNCAELHMPKFGDIAGLPLPLAESTLNASGLYRLHPQHGPAGARRPDLSQFALQPRSAHHHTDFR